MSDSLPGILSPEWFAILRDALNLLLAVVAVVTGIIGIRLAKKANKMAEEQDKVTERQTTLLERLEKLEEKQAQIAETQHEFSAREARKRAVLKVVLPHPPSSSTASPTRYQLYIHNEGDKSGTAFWYLGIPKRMRGRVIVEPSTGNEEVVLPADNWDIFSEFDQPQVPMFTDDYYLLKFMTTRPVEPGVMMPCGAVLIDWLWGPSEWLGQGGIEVRTQAWRIFGWFTNGPNGRLPERGMLKLRMYQRTEATFKNYHGGIELPPDDPEEFP